MKRLIFLTLISSLHLIAAPTQQRWSTKDKAYYAFRATWPTLVATGAAGLSFVAARYVQSRIKNTSLATTGVAVGGNVAGYAASEWLKSRLNHEEKQIEAQSGKKVPYSVNGFFGKVPAVISIAGVGAVLFDMAQTKANIERQLAQITPDAKTQKNVNDGLLEQNLKQQERIAALEKELTVLHQPTVEAEYLASLEATARKLQRKNDRLTGTVTAATVDRKTAIIADLNAELVRLDESLQTNK